MNGFLVGDASDVEKQELFVERLGDFIIAKHLPFENRWSDAAAESHRIAAASRVNLARPTRPPRAPLQPRMVGRAVLNSGCWATAVTL